MLLNIFISQMKYLIFLSIEITKPKRPLSFALRFQVLSLIISILYQIKKHCYLNDLLFGWKTRIACVLSNYIMYLPDLYCLLLSLIIMSQKPFILIADDDQEDRYLLHTAFEEIGGSNDIYLVENGLQVFSYLETSIEQSVMPSLIVLDLNMPILNGMETLSRLKSHSIYKNIPVIMFTTSVHEVEKARCLEIGAADFIKKPARFQRTISTARYLHESAIENRIASSKDC